MQAQSVDLLDRKAVSGPSLARFRQLSLSRQPSNREAAADHQDKSPGDSRKVSGRIALLSRAIVAALMLVAGMGSTAHAEKRVALVVGNSAYQSAVKLDNPAHDAKLMSDTLLSLGFF